MRPGAAQPHLRFLFLLCVVTVDKSVDRRTTAKLVDSVLQGLTGLELGNFRCRDVDLSACLGILTLTCSTLTNTEGTETNQRDFFVSLESIRHGVSHRLEGLLGISFTQSRLFCNRIDKIGFCHNKPPRKIWCIALLKTGFFISESPKKSQENICMKTLMMHCILGVYRISSLLFGNLGREAIWDRLTQNLVHVRNRHDI